MSDNLGPNQSRVLDTENRSWEEVVYQWRKPPLSSEHNLSGKVPSDAARHIKRYLSPSGWAIGGNLKNDISENDCMVGDVLTSSSLAANTIKLIALNKGVETERLIAFVNGYRLLIQGTNSTNDENNIITLNDPPSMGTRVDFVFLEVWRKLIEPEDTVYKHGNYLYGGTNPDNDLIDSAVGIETSLRVQVQYRIRVVDNIDIETYPSGFDPNTVFVQGPLDDPVTTCSHAYFSEVNGNVGLWRAGAGDSVAQEELQTVDGYTYAIPMFAISRRNSHSYEPDNYSNGAGHSLSDYLNGLASDRPDNLYNDWIVSNDILDMRHIVSSQYNMKELCETNLRKLMAGNLRNKMEKSTLGEDHYGKVLPHADAISGSTIDITWAEEIGISDGIRRYFGNAESDQPDTIYIRTVNDKTPNPGNNWAVDDTFDIALPGTYPSGTTISINEAFTHDDLLTGGGTDYDSTVLSGTTAQITIKSTANISPKKDILVDCSLSFPSGANGLSYYPDKFLEFQNKDSTLSIASEDQDIRVRDSSAVMTTDGIKYNMLHNAGGNISEQYDFGHQMIYHALGRGSQTIDINRTINGYSILGIAAAKVDSTYRDIAVNRTLSKYNINLSDYVGLNDDIELTLYTDKKFFEVNKQGRAIKDCFEMRELTPIEPADGARTSFTLDATDQAILAIGSYINDNGYGFSYVSNDMITLQTNNKNLPTDSTKSRVTIDFADADKPSVGDDIKIPVLLRSAVDSSEGFAFFYQRTPYQGILDSSTNGRIEGVGPAYVTTAGSGAMTDASYTVGTASFTEDSTVVSGTNTEWLSNVSAGDVIRSDSDTSNEYHVRSLLDNDTLFITSPAVSNISGSYAAIKKDQPYFQLNNVIDRLPALDSSYDSRGHSEPISTAVSDKEPVLQTRIISPVQDMLDQSANAVSIGINGADRGRSTINIPEAALGRGNLGLKFEKLNVDGTYQKTYQSYILNKENSDELYLMVVGSETDNTSSLNFFNHRSNSDVVDIFHMDGRPITMRRNK